MTQTRIKKLIFRSKHRGCKEMDYVLSKFADNYVASMSPAEMDLYEVFLEEPDDYMWKWVTGEIVMPEEYNIFKDRLVE
jgi:antitoxin CptB